MEYKQDAAAIKENIMRFIKSNGPCLPIHVSKGVSLSMLFTSAFLSELFSEQAVKMTNMRVGSSPVYFIEGQEPMLEKFSQHLKSREKDAFAMLKEKKLMKDSEQEPAIRVALRMIKDFAVPFEKSGELFWSYYLPDEKEIPEIKMPAVETISEEPIQILEEKENEEDYQKKEKPKKEKIIKKEKSKQENKSKKPNKKKDENFFNKIKEFLSKKGIEIMDIKDFKNDEAVLKVKKDKKEEIIFVFNKKKITEKEILKAHKKASEEKMQYSILSLGEAPKKLTDLISALKDLSKIEKIE